MKVRDIIKLTARMTGRNDVVDYLNGGKGQTQTLETVAIMVELCNLVINELASLYIPLVNTEFVVFSYQYIPYSRLTEKVVRIRNVYDINGVSVKFNDAIQEVYANLLSGYIEYEYSPSTYDLDSVIGYTEKDVSAGIIAYGVSAEYSINQGLFEQAVMFHKRYVDGVAEKRSLKNAVIKERSWR